jgi:hypothetical protein
VYNLVLNFTKAYTKGCVLATTKGMHGLALITDLKLINCVDTSDYVDTSGLMFLEIFPCDIWPNGLGPLWV